MIINDNKLIKNIENAKYILKEMILRHPNIRKKDLEKQQVLIFKA